MSAAAAGRDVSIVPASASIASGCFMGHSLFGRTSYPGRRAWRAPERRSISGVWDSWLWTCKSASQTSETRCLGMSPHGEIAGSPVRLNYSPSNWFPRLAGQFPLLGPTNQNIARTNAGEVSRAKIARDRNLQDGAFHHE